jgi:electron transfer flavoprotein alpha subunit
MSILVWIEQSNGAAVSSCWEVLGKARDLANDLNTSLAAVVTGAETAATAQAASNYGADTVFTVTSPLLGAYRLSAYAAALQQAVGASGATVLLTSGTQRGRELSAFVACQLQAGLAPDSVDLRTEGGKLVAVRSVYSNNILTDVTYDSALQVASVRPRSFPMPEAGAGKAALQAIDLKIGEDAIPEKVIESRSTDSGEINLTDASKIVSGGRGVAADPAKGFQLVTELAGTIGAAVGASRAAVDAGYIPYRYQVGQTGKTVRPDLYIAAGISGAIQHLAGMGSSKVIVAINKDNEAPIFERANYGIIGDLYEILPALSAEFKKRLG